MTAVGDDAGSFACQRHGRRCRRVWVRESRRDLAQAHLLELEPAAVTEPAVRPVAPRTPVTEPQMQLTFTAGRRAALRARLRARLRRLLTRRTR